MLHLQSYNGRFVSSHLFSFRGRFLQSFSISTTTERSPKSIVSFMVNSLGLSNQQSAISTPRKVLKSNPKENPNSVIDFFKQNGFDDTQITNIISKNPPMLRCDVEKTLKPKFRVLQDLGLSGSDLGDFIAACECTVFQTLSADVIDFLTPIFGTNENVVKALRKSYYMLSADTATRNFTLLQNLGMAGERLQKALIQHQEILTCKPERLKNVCARIESEFGLSPKSHAFIPMIRVLIVNKAETLEQKYKLFKSYGWTESDIGNVIRKQPDCLNLSKATIRRKLEYFMKEHGLDAGYMASRPNILGYSLEKKVVPRNAVLQVLKERKLVSDTFSLFSALTMSEAKFLRRYVVPYKDELPGLFDLYRKTKLDSFSRNSKLRSVSK